MLESGIRREMAEPMQSPGLAMFSASMKSSADASARIWRSVPKPFPANRRPGAFQEPQPADHIAENRDDLRRAEAALAGCLVGLLVGRERVLELLQVDESPCDLEGLLPVLALIIPRNIAFNSGVCVKNETLL